MDKAQLRFIYKQKRKDMDDDERFAASVAICNTLFNHPYYTDAKMIGFYVSLPEEVETILLMEQAFKKKRIAAPKVEGDIMNFYRIRDLSDLQPGSFHIFEPTTPYLAKPRKMDLIIVPVLAFNEERYRIGYGKGFYDKYLENYHGHTIGLAFEDCKVNDAFQESHDKCLDVIISEKKIYEDDSSSLDEGVKNGK